MLLLLLVKLGTLQVPSCCVLTSGGLSVLPGSIPGGVEFSHALQQLLQGVQSSSLQLLGNDGLKVATEADAAGETGVAVGILWIRCCSTATAAHTVQS